MQAPPGRSGPESAAEIVGHSDGELGEIRPALPAGMKANLPQHSIDRQDGLSRDSVTDTQHVIGASP